MHITMHGTPRNTLASILNCARAGRLALIEIEKRKKPSHPIFSKEFPSSPLLSQRPNPPTLPPSTPHPPLFPKKTFTVAVAKILLPLLAAALATSAEEAPPKALPGGFESPPAAASDSAAAPIWKRKDPPSSSSYSPHSSLPNRVDFKLPGGVGEEDVEAGLVLLPSRPPRRVQPPATWERSKQRKRVSPMLLRPHVDSILPIC